MSSIVQGALQRPADVGAAFVLGSEQECLTVVSGEERAPTDAPLRSLFKRLRSAAPTLPSSRGLFNPYGRLYVDNGMHLELASMECESPYLLAQVVETQQRLVRAAVEAAHDGGARLEVANNNHSGLLEPGAPTWGAHENYLLECPARNLAPALLPFLATRLYAGAGGIEHPSGRFLAAVRPLFMRHDVGGGTTRERAVYSVAREEHHMGPAPTRFRLHLIVGDGLRSQFGLALTFGATALALKAVQCVPELADELRRLDAVPDGRSWADELRRYNVLAEPGAPLGADPRALAIQGAYLDAAERYASALPARPAWIERTLGDWRETLARLAACDQEWLGRRLDPFIKRELYGELLRESGSDWRDLPSKPHLFRELALLDHAYHAFGAHSSPFEALERAGLLEQRVAPPLTPGEESEPFVPPTITRARARARFLFEHAGASELVMGWSGVYSTRDGTRRTLSDPFAQDYSPWEYYQAARGVSELEM